MNNWLTEQPVIFTELITLPYDSNWFWLQIGIRTCSRLVVLIVVMELVGERYRPGLGTAIQVAFSLGYMLQPVIAYKLRDEFWYQVAATAPNLVFPFVVMYVQISSTRLLYNTARAACFLL